MKSICIQRKFRKKSRSTAILLPIRMNPFPMVSAWNLHIMFPLKQVHKSGGGGGGGGRHKSGEGAVGDTLPSGVRRSPSSYVFSY